MPIAVTLQRTLDRAPGGTLFKDMIDAYERWRWNRRGRPAPAPNAVKREVIRRFGQQHRIGTLVETGTFLGGTVDAMLPFFERIYSIELSESLHRRAQRRFEGINSVELIQGDSAVQLPRVLARLNCDALFWLDGHYSAGFTAKGSKDTPVVEEVQAVLSVQGRRHLVLIDDARLFNGSHDYPTLRELEALILATNAEYSMSVADDIIRVLPNR